MLPEFQETMYFFIPLNDIALGIEERSQLGCKNLIQTAVETTYRRISRGLKI
jgi:hypothetical protein